MPSSHPSPVLAAVDDSNTRSVYQLVARPTPVFARYNDTVRRTRGRSIPSYFRASPGPKTSDENDESLKINGSLHKLHDVPQQEAPNSAQYCSASGQAMRTLRMSRTPNTSGDSTLPVEDAESSDRVRITSQSSRWNSFLATTALPEASTNEGFIDEKVLETQDLSGAWIGDTDVPSGTTKGEKRKGHGSQEPLSLSKARYFMTEESREVWKPRLNFILLNNPMVPLTLRAIIFVLSIIALALACSVYVHSRLASPMPITQQPSTIMAVVVQTTALVYLVYITYDEYSGKPIGLREPKAKMRLIMLDLLFIIFSSANLSLTFNTLFDATWACRTDSYDPTDASLKVPYNGPICTRQRGLAAFLFMVLVMWVATFTISIFRLVERVSQQ